MGLVASIGKWVSDLFSAKSIQDAAKLEVATSQDMLDAQELWRDVYRGKAPWNPRELSLHLASGLCVEAARAVTVELQSEIVGSARAEYLQSQYLRVLKGLRGSVEMCCAGGTVILRPFVRGDDIHVSTVENNCFLPLKYDELGELTNAVFIDRLKEDKKYYTLLEKCTLEDGNYTIEYTAYRSGDENTLGREIALTEVERWAGLPPSITFNDVSIPWFSVFKMPQSNHIEQGAPEGVSLFSKAVDLFKEADKQFGRILWEYEGSELAINANSDLFQRVDGNKKGGTIQHVLPRGKERLYRALNSDDPSFVMETFSPAIRDESLFNGLDKIKRQIEFVCGMAYGTISDPQSIDRTATEIKIARQRSYSTVADIQAAAEAALRRLIDIMDDIATRYMLSPQGEYEVSFQWDDSIVTDREAEFRERKDAQDKGWLFPAENRAWYNGSTLEQAQAEIAELGAGLLESEF